MSYILDALRKSESERQRDASTSLSRAPLAAVRHRIPAWTWILIGILSLALIALAATAWRNARLDPAAPASSPASIEPTDQPPPEPSSVPVRETAPETAADAPPRLRPIRELATIEPSLPGYRLELLAFNGQNPSASYARINGSNYSVGDRIGTGPEIVEVRADGVILAYGGDNFLLTTR